MIKSSLLIPEGESGSINMQSDTEKEESPVE
jgi:hypothetical protein